MVGKDKTITIFFLLTVKHFLSDFSVIDNRIGKNPNIMMTKIYSSCWLLLFVVSFVVEQGCGWIISTTQRPLSFSTRSALQMNVLSDIGDFLTGGKLTPQTKPPVYGNPLDDDDEILTNNEVKTLAVQERAISFTGEDFDVWDVDGNRQYCTVRGAMLHLPGKDKMRIKKAGSGNAVAVLDRKLVALTPTYDIYRGDGQEKIGFLEKATIALTDTFEFHAQNGGGFGPFKPPAAYKLEGDFLDRRFVMKNDKGEVVAKITQDQLIEFDQFNHYQIRIASGMDPMLVVACACAIDEEFDEEHKKRKEQQNP
jgi:uncharacterized protein YxjI